MFGSLSVFLSVCQSVSLSVCQSVSLSVCQSVSLSVCQSVSLSVCQSVSLSVCQSVGLYVCLCVFLSACLSICLSVFLSIFRLSVNYMSSICLSLCLYLTNVCVYVTCYVRLKLGVIYHLNADRLLVSLNIHARCNYLSSQMFSTNLGKKRSFYFRYKNILQLKNALAYYAHPYNYFLLV
jgi:hypothetical protein